MQLPVTVSLGADRAAAAIPVRAGGPNAKKALPFLDVASDAGLSRLLAAESEEDAAEAEAIPLTSRRAAAVALRASAVDGEERWEFLRGFVEIFESSGGRKE